MKTKTLVITLLFLSLISCKMNHQTKDSFKTKVLENYYENTNDKFLKPIGYINDYSNLLTELQITELENIITEYENQTTREIVFVAINSIKPYDDIHLYATELGQKWGVGKVDKKNGLILVMSKNLREIAIATGYGTEKTLTDKICKKVIDSIIVPEFKKDNYYFGIKNGVEALIKKWE